MLIEIENDVYFILDRLKEIDKNYQIFFNTKRNVFEVHSIGQIGGSYCLTVPYKILDKRTLDLVNKTKRENSERLFEEMERENKKLEAKKNDEMVKQAESIMRKLWKSIKIYKKVRKN